MLVLVLYILLVLAVAGVAILGINAVVLYKRAVDLNPLFARKKELQEKIASLDTQLNNNEAKLKDLQQQQAVSEQIINKAEADRQWLKDNESVIQTAKAERALADSILADFAKKQQAEQQKLDDIIKQLQEKQKELYAAENTVAQLNAQESVLENSIRTLKAQKTAHTQQEQAARNELTKAQNDLSAVQSQLAMLKTQLQSRQLDLQSKQQDLEDKRAELKIAQAALDDVSKKNIALKGENHELEIQLNAKRPNVNQWGDLERPVFEFTGKGKIKDNNAEESKWLQEFQKRLYSHGIIFSERMLYAFHTGMKVADLSPLVVLAGISGTGKSLLPQLYARAMGMNFVQLAVQPRWDSPQDMLGFFNYTENRFKATELSRLLWQYDRWNNKNPNVPQDDASLPMNLVLLDEMNLARVEYYFSDLLSKLEVRRTIDANDAVSRRAAEIEIECGATKDNADTRRLFVAPNTLFVGTMNEDETTQTLSDKVMDRANVLRFGRPLKLDAKPDTQGFMKAYGNCRMTLATWEKAWKKSADKAQGLKIGNMPLTAYIDGINSILAEIERPFAHRVWQAMRLYVANYPDMSDVGIKHAVADQIELKIMPKLNGLQTQGNKVSQAFEQLQNQIDILGDDELTQAFHESRDNNDIFFKWHGVTRN